MIREETDAVVVTKITTAVVTEMEPLLFNSRWTAYYIPITEARVCNDCRGTLPRGTTALVIKKDGRQKFTFCSVSCQRRAYVTAKAKKAKRWRKSL